MGAHLPIGLPSFTAAAAPSRLSVIASLPTSLLSYVSLTRSLIRSGSHLLGAGSVRDVKLEVDAPRASRLRTLPGCIDWSGGRPQMTALREERGRRTSWYLRPSRVCAWVKFTNAVWLVVDLTVACQALPSIS